MTVSDYTLLLAVESLLASILWWLPTEITNEIEKILELGLVLEPTRSIE